MRAEVFVDTNILYYALTESADPRHAVARARVTSLWDAPGHGAVSVQVLQELHVNLLKKAGLSASQSVQRLNPYLSWPVVDNDRALLLAAFDVQARWKLSFWDSTIVAAAQRSGAASLWSEDLANGQRFGDIRVRNPLLPDFDPTA